MSNAAILPLKVVGAAPVAPPRPASRSNRSQHGRVRAELDRIVSSADFEASPRSHAFLRFVVEETLAGQGDALTQAAIAIRVFGRRDDFDPLSDPIVRIQAGRLRRSLERYYLLSGKSDALRIELPRGTYEPVFRSLAESPPVRNARLREVATWADPAVDWPSVSVSRFSSAGPEAVPPESESRLVETLVMELGRYRDVRTLLQSELDLQEPFRRERARFSLEGRLCAENGGLRVTARLVDHSTGAQVWGDEYRSAAQPGRWSGSPDDIARVIAARVAGEEGVLVQWLAAEDAPPRSTPSRPYGALLRFYEFSQARDPLTLSAALHALRRVVADEPGCGPAWTRLASLYVANHALEVTGMATPMDDAISYAQRGVSGDPASRRARAVLAAALLVKGELTAARRELEDALRVSADSFVYLEVIGHLLSLVGDGERGPSLIRAARERNPHCLPHGSFGLWFDHLRRGQPGPAYEEALEYRDPAFFWRAVMRACCLAHLGRRAEAESNVAEILRGKQDFAARGRVLIGHFVKHPEVMDRIVDGLARAGLKLA